jgi:hypothetical protein
MADTPITPTIGRVVLINAHNLHGDVPAIVNGNYDDFPNLIDATVFPRAGIPYALTSLSYSEDIRADGVNVGWHWMPYQLKVAETTDPV